MSRFSCFILILLYSANCAGGDKIKSLRSGTYGSFLGITKTDKHIYGLCEYYEKWNEDIGFYENVCKFYFYGDITESDTISLKVGLPEIEIANGKIVLHGNDSITLYTDFSSGYMFVDLGDEGFSAKLNKQGNNDLGLGVVKDERCYLHNTPTTTDITKAYIIKRDFVSILERKDQWIQVQYVSPISGKTFKKWIKSDALYDENPENW